MGREQIRGHSDEIRQVSRRRKNGPQSAATLTSRQLELGLPLGSKDQVEQPDRDEAPNRASAIVHSEGPVISQVTGPLDPSREKHQNAIVASREELIGELSAYLRTDLKTLYDPAIREFTPDEEAQFSEWVEGLTDEELHEQIELRGEMLTQKIKSLAALNDYHRARSRLGDS